MGYSFILERTYERDRLNQYWRFAGFEPFRPIRTNAGLLDAGLGEVVLEEMLVARLKPLWL